MALVRNSIRSEGFEAIEASIQPVAPASKRRTTAGEAGGRGWRVMMQEDSDQKGSHGIAEKRTSSTASAAASSSGAARSAGLLSEGNRAHYKKLIDDTQNLINWFNADPTEEAAPQEEISLSDFKDACKSLGVDHGVQELAALCENNDLSTSLRAIQLLNSKMGNFIKQLDEIKKKEREARQAERAAKKAKIEAEKKAKKEAEEKAKRDAQNILRIEASIILTLQRGSLPTTDASQNCCSSETHFYRSV